MIVFDFKTSYKLTYILFYFSVVDLNELMKKKKKLNNNRSAIVVFDRCVETAVGVTIDIY